MKKEHIIEILHTIEKEKNIEILYACEAGSRAWGFANDESDWDIRFIFKRHDVKDYLSLNHTEDVIEWIGEKLDIVGWDIKKALNLHYKDNPNLRELFLSDMVYIDRGIESMFSGLGGFDINVLKNHYCSISHSHWKKYCCLEFKKQKTKKYLYVLRSILCWRLLNRDIYPPININDLLNHNLINLDGNIKAEITHLINYHQDNGDLSEDCILKLNNFILDSLSRMETTKTKSFKDISDYNERFRELLMVTR